MVYVPVYRLNNNARVRVNDMVAVLGDCGNVLCAADSNFKS